MFKKCKPIPWNEFPTDEKIIDGTNCLAFALGIKKPQQRRNQYCLVPGKKSIEELFIDKVKQLGFNPKQFRRISKEEEEREKGYIIRIYGFALEETVEYGICYDFHLIRREPNGKWVHKPGFYYPAAEVSYWHWTAIFEKFGSEYVSFVLDAK